MYRMRETREAESMGGSINSTMGEPLVASNKLAYSGHQELPIAPDVITSGVHALRGLLSDPPLGDLRVLSELNRSLGASACACG